jgi:sugar phosphate isomerase/epimerase
MLDRENIMMRAHWEIMDEYLRMADEFGLGIELGDFCRADILEDRNEYARRIALMKETVLPLNLGRTLHAPFRKILPHARERTLRRRSRDLIRQAVDTAQELSCSTVVIHSGYDERNDGPQELARMADDFAPFLEELLDRFSPALALENIHDRNGSFLEEIGRRIDRPRLGFCMDVGHMFAFGEVPFSRWYESFAGRILHNHWHDNRGDRDAHAPLGEGSVDWAEIGRLRRTHCPGSTVALEIPSEAGIRKSLETLVRAETVQPDKG